MYYLFGITAAVPDRQKTTPSLRRENDRTLDTRSTFPITVSSASESSTVGSSTYTTENNNSPLTRGHELLVVRSPQEQHDYIQQGSCFILCQAFSPNLKNTLNLTYHVTSVCVSYTSKY